MKGNAIARFVIIILFLLFMALYLSQATGYYKFEEYKKTTLTNNAIEKFEKDLAAGKEIDINNYLEDEKHYSNIFSSMGLKASNIIEKSFNTVMNYIFSEMNKAVEENNN